MVVKTKEHMKYLLESRFENSTRIIYIAEDDFDCDFDCETRHRGLRPYVPPCAHFIARTPGTWRRDSTPPTQERSRNQSSHPFSPSGLAALHWPHRHVWQCQPLPWELRVASAAIHLAGPCRCPCVSHRMSVLARWRVHDLKLLTFCDRRRFLVRRHLRLCKQGHRRKFMSCLVPAGSSLLTCSSDEGR